MSKILVGIEPRQTSIHLSINGTRVKIPYSIAFDIWLRLGVLINHLENKRIDKFLKASFSELAYGYAQQTEGEAKHVVV